VVVNFYEQKDEEVMSRVAELGFPREYVQKCLSDNLNNHCTTSYYLLVMNQNYAKLEA
jgi:hypothetical protein